MLGEVREAGDRSAVCEPLMLRWGCSVTVGGRRSHPEVMGVGAGRGLPDFLVPLFWDVDPASLLPGHESFVIERILNYGDIPAIRWMWQRFSDDAVTSVVRTSRRLTRKAATFWALVYDVPLGEVRSLAKEEWTGVSAGRS